MAVDRHKLRELAMQVLFLWDSHGDNDAALAAQAADAGLLDDEARRESLRMASEAWNAREAADQWVARLAPQWPPRRQPGVDRSILRLGIWELTAGQTPPKVVIDEAIELAKSFSTEQSPAFVNGVLDAAHKENRELIAERSRKPEARSQ
jgi:N utilization substance protein B